jgi:hypothetical protein
MNFNGENLCQRVQFYLDTYSGQVLCLIYGDFALTINELESNPCLDPRWINMYEEFTFSRIYLTTTYSFFIVIN